MIVWLIKISEPLPIQGNEKKMRTGTLAKRLIDSGHTVTWWASTFDHQSRSHLYNSNKHIKINDRFVIKLLHSSGYRRTWSPKRFFSQWRLSKIFYKLALNEKKPDIIIASMPCIELCKSAAEYGESMKIPVVLDIRDKWPDIFLDRLPSITHPIANIVFNHYRKQLSYSAKRASAIFGITEHFVEYGLKHAERAKNHLDADFSLTTETLRISNQERQDGLKFWKNLSVIKDCSTLKVVFAGTMSSAFDFDTILENAETFEGKVQFIITGSGAKYEDCKRKATHLTNVIVPGWMEPKKLKVLLELSDIGLAPYRRTPDFMNSLPNKISEYLLYGLPILTSLEGGRVDKLITDEKCGLAYNKNNFVKQVNLLANQGAYTENMSKNAFKTYKNNFNPDEIYDSMTARIELIIHQHKEKNKHGEQKQDKNSCAFNICPPKI
jgi:glycosyltransferase involved in cell wall biosynthesis